MMRNKLWLLCSIALYLSLDAKQVLWMEYIACDNDLYRWAILNLQDMAKVGSNQHLNIVAQVDCLGAHGKTKRLHVLPNKIMEVAHGQKLDFGAVDTLVDFVEWAIKAYPSDEYVLTFWNHGSGFYDPTLNHGHKINSADALFYFNPKTQLLEIDRSLPYILLDERDPRGVCFCDTTQSYLSNVKLFDALSRITQLLGKKLSIIGFDACLMQMVEVVTQVSQFADYVIASPEVELASGWQYDYIFEPFMYNFLETSDFARHIVASYERAYKNRTADYTLSVIDTREVDCLNYALDDVARGLLTMLSLDRTGIVKKTILACRHKNVCTTFSEPTYIDIHHFFMNVKAALVTLPACQTQEASYAFTTVSQALDTALLLIEKAVIANVKGRNIPHSSGLSIYFPEKRIDPSYSTLIFGKNKWHDFLKTIVSY